MLECELNLSQLLERVLEIAVAVAHKLVVLLNLRFLICSTLGTTMV